MVRKTVLVPLDGSEFSRAILTYVAEVLSPEHYTVVLFRVAEPAEEVTAGVAHPTHEDTVLRPGYESFVPSEAVPPAPVEATIYASQLWDAERTGLAEELARDAQPLKEAGFDVSVEASLGDPATEIVNFAGHKAVGLIAMATHGRTGLRQLVLGSVAERVMCGAPVPVLLVRPFAEACDREPADSQA